MKNTKKKLMAFSLALKILTIFSLVCSVQAKNIKDNKILKSIEITKDMVSGIPSYSDNHSFTRLPNSIKSKIRPILWKLSKQQSGVRIRFKTNSKRLQIDAFSTNTSTPYNMNNIMKNGIDIYINNIYSGSAWPDKAGKIRKCFRIKEKGINNITFYMPLYGNIRIRNIKISKSSIVLNPDDLKKNSLIVYYGSSITQGGAASNPGMSYQAILSRSIGVDFINLGFSGNGFGDIEIADYIGTLKSSLIVLDYWANPTSEIYKSTLPKFVKKIREKQQNTPILIISPLYSISPFCSLDIDKVQKKKREITYHFVKMQKRYGDKNIYFFDGNQMLSKKTAFGLVDGRHLNTLGFWFCANALEPTIKKLLGLEEKNKTLNWKNIKLISFP